MYLIRLDSKFICPRADLYGVQKELDALFMENKGVMPENIEVYKQVNFTYKPPVSSLVID